MELYPDDLLQVLEFDRIRERISNYCRCESSKELALALAPVSEHMELLKQLVRVEEYLGTLESKGYFPDFLFDEFQVEARLLSKPGSTLSEGQADRIRSACRIVNNLLKFFRERASAYPALIGLAEGILEDLTIAELIDEYVDSQCLLKNNASPELMKIRSELSAKRREADRRFRSYINDLRKKGWIRDNEENFYNNRRVLAVPSEHRRDINGIVHGRSDTGKTTFIEPEGMVELNNEVAELELDERNEVMRLLRELSDRLRPHSSTIQEHHRFLSELDFIRAKALFSVDTGSRIPRLEPSPELHLINAVHPLLYLQNKSNGKQTIPLTLELDSRNRMLIISGPNAGGKSITLKTVGLLQLMLQSGLPVPVAEGSRMGFFSRLSADIGDSQSIENALSTYSSRLIRMNRFIRTSNNRTLVLIDEFGTGTDPELGGAIAEVVLEELNRRKTLGVFTTHYTNIKLLADHLEGVRNASMLFDPATLQPLYRLIVGQPGSSYTFEVAERIGLPKHVLDRARQKVQREKLRLNKMLGTLHQQKHQLEEEIKLNQERRQRTEAAESRFEQLSRKLNEKMERERLRQDELRQLSELGRKMKSLADEWEKTGDKKSVIGKFVASMTAEKKKRAAENTAEKVAQRRQALLEKLRKAVKVGTEVRMLKSKQTGIVTELKKDTVVVDFGNLKASVALENIEPVDPDQPKKKAKRD